MFLMDTIFQFILVPLATIIAIMIIFLFRLRWTIGGQTVYILHDTRCPLHVRLWYLLRLQLGHCPPLPSPLPVIAMLSEPQYRELIDTPAAYWPAHIKPWLLQTDYNKLWSLFYLQNYFHLMFQYAFHPLNSRVSLCVAVSLPSRPFNSVTS